MVLLEKYLEEIGLSEKEAKIYLTLLQFDSANIQEITNKSKINRTTVYPVLETLTKKGLVNESVSNKKTTYQAVSPEHLETFIEQQKIKLQEKLHRLKDIIPQIKSIQRESGERPLIKFFEGHDGAIAAYEEFYRMHSPESKDGFFIFNRNLLRETFTEKEHDRFRAIRIGKQVHVHTVYTSEDVADTFKTQGERKRIDSKKFPIATDISVIEDKVIITTLGGKVSSFIIKSKDIADTFKSLIAYILEQK